MSDTFLRPKAGRKFMPLNQRSNLLAFSTDCLLGRDGGNDVVAVPVTFLVKKRH